jgi:hypothetical protein
MKYLVIVFVAGMIGFMCCGCKMTGLNINEIDTKPTTVETIEVPVPAAPVQ